MCSRLIDAVALSQRRDRRSEARHLNRPFWIPAKELAMAELKVVDVTEQKRLNDAREVGMPWKKWGPLLQARIVTEQVGGEPVAV